nr:unnamed protein product [Spirometra erinaceieuropaei]
MGLTGSFSSPTSATQPVQQLSSTKAPTSDKILADVYSHGGAGAGGQRHTSIITPEPTLAESTTAKITLTTADDHSPDASKSSVTAATIIPATNSVATATTATTPPAAGTVDNTPGFAWTTTIFTNELATSNADTISTCSHCDRTFTSHIGPASYLRINNTHIDELVPESPACARRIRLHCPLGPCKFTHRMGLFGHIRIHDNETHHNINMHSTPCAPDNSSISSTSTYQRRYH